MNEIFFRRDGFIVLSTYPYIMRKRTEIISRTNYLILNIARFKVKDNNLSSIHMDFKLDRFLFSTVFYLIKLKKENVINDTCVRSLTSFFSNKKIQINLGTFFWLLSINVNHWVSSFELSKTGFSSVVNAFRFINFDNIYIYIYFFSQNEDGLIRNKDKIMKFL